MNNKQLCKTNPISLLPILHNRYKNLIARCPLLKLIFQLPKSTKSGTQTALHNRYFDIFKESRHLNENK